MATEQQASKDGAVSTPAHLHDDLRRRGLHPDTPEWDHRSVTTAADLRRLVLALPGTAEAPHFDRAAFKVARIYVTLAADEKTANFKFTPDEQALKCAVAPEAFAPVPNKWGAQGWTTARLAMLSESELKAALEMAWTRAQPKPKVRRKR